MAGELDLGSIVMRIRADLSGVQKGVDQLEREMGRMTRSTQAAGGGVDAASKGMSASVNASAMAQAAAYGTMAAAATKAMRVVIGAIVTGVEAINKYRAAMIGLESVASGRGIGSAAMEKALARVADAFFDVSAASTAFKNLLARGYNLDQATQSIINLKNAAAFGRQASLGLAEAVVSATEGLKNENSILVDNAGVTKNVSKMWEDYARSIGVGVMSLTTAQKVQAEVAGIMTETRFQTGDMIKLQATLAGTQAETTLAAEQLARAYGESMSPAVQLATELWGGFLGSLRDAVQAFPGVIAGATAAGLAIGGFVVIQKAVLAFQAFKAAIAAATGGVAAFGAAVNTALPWMAAIAAVFGIATAVYTQLSKEASDAAAAQEEQNKAAEERRRSIDAEVGSLTALRDRYAELTKNSTLTREQSAELLEIEKSLETQFGITIGLLSSLAGGYESVTGKINEQIAAKLKLTEAERRQEVNAAGAKLTALENQYDSATNILLIQKKWQELLQEMDSYNVLSTRAGISLNPEEAINYDYYVQKYNDAKASLEQILSSVGLSLESDFQTTVDKARADLDAASQALDGARKDYIEKSLTFAEDIQRAAGADISSSTAAAVRDFYRQLLQAYPDMNLNQFWGQYAAALQQSDTGPALQAMKDMQQRIMEGGLPKAEDLSTLTGAYNAAVKIVRDAGQVMGATEDQMIDMMGFIAPAFRDVFSGVKDLNDVLGDLAANSIAAVTQQAPEALSAWIGKATENARKDIGDLTKLAQEAKKQSDIVKGLNFMRINWDRQDSEGFKIGVSLLAEYGEAVPKNLAVVNQEYENHSKILKGANIDQSALMESMRGSVASLKQYRDALDENSAGYKLLDALVAELETSFFSIAAIRTPELSIDPGKYVSDLEKIDKSFKGLGDTAKSTFADMEALASRIAGDSKLQSALAQLKGEIEGGRGTGQLAESLREYIRGTAEYANASLSTIDEINAAIDTTAVRQAAAAGETELLTARIDQLYTDLIEGQKQFAESSAEYKIFEGLIAQIGQWKAAMADAGTVKFTVEGADGAKDLQELSAQLEAIGKAAQDIRVKQDSIAGIQRLVAEAKKARTAGKDFSKQWEQITAFLGKDFTGSLDDADASIEAMAAGTKAAMDSASSSLDTMEAQILSLIAAAEQDITVSPQVKSANLGPLYALLAVINAIRKATGQAAISGGGGGGGGQSAFQKDIAAMAHEVEMGRLTLEGELKKLEALEAKYQNKRGKSALKADDQEDLDERIYNKREELREKALADDYAALDHRKTLNTISISEEIAALEKIRTTHQLNAEEMMEIEEKLYDARTRQKESLYQWDIALLDHQLSTSEMSAAEEISRLERIRDAHELSQEQQYEVEERVYALRRQLQEEQESAVTSAYKRITDALKNQLNEQKDMELEALDERIGALNALTKAENEAARKEDYAKNLADKQRELATEKSARRRRELREEIAEMEAAEATRLAQETRQAEIDALNDQKKAVTDKYAALATEENLRQEALRLVMSGNLQQMTDLIASYGEEWQDAGAQLAEALSSGLLGNSSAILDTINSLTTAIQDSINDQLAAIGMNLPGAAGKGGVIININSLMVREDADVGLVADEIYKKMQAAGR